MVEEGHYVNAEPGHVFSYGKWHMTEVVHIVEYRCVLKLLVSPFDIFGISQLVFLTGKNSQGEI